MEQDCTQTSSSLSIETNKTTSHKDGAELLNQTSSSEVNIESSEVNGSEVLIEASSSEVTIETSSSEVNGSEVLIETSEVHGSEVITEATSSEVIIDASSEIKGSEIHTETSSSEINTSEVLIETSNSEVHAEESISEIKGIEVIKEASSTEIRGSEVLIETSSSDVNGSEVIVEASSSEIRGSDLLQTSSSAKQDFSKKQEECHSIESFNVEKGEVTVETKTVTEDSNDNEAVTIEENSDKIGFVESARQEVTAVLQQDQTQALGNVGNLMQVSEVNLMISSEASEEKVEMFNENVTIEIVENTSSSVEETEKKIDLNNEETFLQKDSEEISVQGSINQKTGAGGWEMIQNGGVEVRVGKESCGEESVKEISVDQSHDTSHYFSAEESFTETDTEWQFSKEISADTKTSESVASVGCIPDHTAGSVGGVPDHSVGSVGGVDHSAGSVVTPDLIKACNGARPDSSQQVRE